MKVMLVREMIEMTSMMKVAGMTITKVLVMEDYKTMAEGLSVAMSMFIRLKIYVVVSKRGVAEEMTKWGMRYCLKRYCLTGLMMWEMLRMMVDFKMMSMWELSLCGMEFYKRYMGKPIMIVTEVREYKMRFV